MPVDAAELDGLSVDPDHALVNADFAQTHLFRDPFLTALHQQRIQIRIFSVPQNGVFKRKRNAVRRFPLQQFLSVSIQQPVSDRGITRPVQFHRYFGCGIALFQRRAYEIIPQMLFTAAQDVYIPEDARHAQLVLVFKIGAVTPFQHQHIDTVFALAQHVRHVKFGGGMGNLTVSRKRTVDPQVEAAVHALKAQSGLFLRLRLPDEAAGIQSAGILKGHIRRIKGNGIHDIGVLMAVISMALPHRRNRDRGFTHGLLNNILRHIQQALIIAEAPLAAEQEKPFRSGTLAAQCRLPAAKRNEIRMIGQGVDMQMLKTLMISG